MLFLLKTVRLANLKNIYEEYILKINKTHFIISFLIMISLIARIMKSKHTDHTLNLINLKFTLFGFLFIIFLEIIIQNLLHTNILQNLIVSLRYRFILALLIYTLIF